MWPHRGSAGERPRDGQGGHLSALPAADGLRDQR